ncbi:MAG TPA: hypothetical protein VKI44_40870 [Acetobacteraceae bacterium]|nr:hypothetical protein [Acetobacteraceae bacterium]
MKRAAISPPLRMSPPCCLQRPTKPTAQAERQKREADTAARDAATETEHRALGLLAEALDTPTPPAHTKAPKADPVAEAEH